MGDIYIGNSGVARKAEKVYVGVNGVARQVQNIYIGVNGVAREVYTAFTPHIASALYSTTSQYEQTGWTVDADRLQRVREKGYSYILCDNLEDVGSGNLLWYVEITYDDNTTQNYTLTGQTTGQVPIHGIKFARLVYLSSDGNLAEGIGDFDFVQ